MSEPIAPARAAALAAGAAAAAHCGALGAGFVFDDGVYYADSAFLQSLGNLFRVAGAGYWESGELSWRPVAVALQLLQRTCIGANPAAHAVSVALHAAVAWLLARLLMDLKLPAAAAAAGAALFAVHPALTEAVVQVSFAEDLWAALFLLLSARLIARGPGGPGRAAAAAGLALLAMGSKESALIFPLCWWLVARRDAERWREGWKPTAVAGGAALALFVLLRFVVFRNPHPSGVGQLPNLVTGDLWILGRYAQVLLWPWTLLADYGVPNPAPVGGWILGVVAVAAGGGLAWWRPEARPGLLWFGAALLPVMNLVALSSPAAERFLYLPAIGLAWAVAAWLAAAPEERRPALLYAVGALCLVAAVRTQVRARDYDSNEALWTATLRANPASVRALQNLGTIRLEQGQPEEAVLLFRERLKRYPDQPDGRFSLALGMRQWAVAAGPGSLDFAKRLAEAERLLREELKRWPEAWKARVLLADLQIGKGRFAEALAELARVAPEHHGSIHFLQTRITALARAGRGEEARRVLAEAQRLHPGHPGLQALAQALGR